MPFTYKKYDLQNSFTATSLNLSPKDELPPQQIKQTISCNTLRVPEETNISSEEEIQITMPKEIKFESPTKTYSPSAFLQKIFKFEEKIVKKSSSPKTYSETSPKRLGE